MSPSPTRSSFRAASAAIAECTRIICLRALALTLVTLVAVGGALPRPAQAHGPVAPVATSFLAKVRQTPPGVRAKVVDGYVRLWLRVAPTESLVILDYRGAPYVRFARSGVWVNQSSEMYYLNLNPVESPPPHLSPSTAPRWRHVSGGHEYSWHDGRIGALTATALAPHTSYVGTWRISVLVNGHLGTISGGLWHAESPSLVWCWLIVVLIACILAAWRLHRPALDRPIARALAIVVLAALSAGGAARWLHGRPGVPAEQVILVAGLVLFATWGIARTLVKPNPVLLYWIAAIVALWVGIELLPTLLHGFVLAALPPFPTRVSAVLCLGGSLALCLLGVSLISEPSALGGGTSNRDEAGRGTAGVPDARPDTGALGDPLRGPRR